MRVTTRAVSDTIDGVGDTGELRVRVVAPPTDGRANESVRRLVAAAFDIGASRVTIERGHTSREKLVGVDGVDAQELRSRWPGLRVR